MERDRIFLRAAKFIFSSFFKPLIHHQRILTTHKSLGNDERHLQVSLIAHFYQNQLKKGLGYDFTLIR